MITPRKCKICGKDIIFEKERENCLYDKNAFYHTSCFVESKLTGKKPWSEDRLGVFLPSATEEAKRIIDEKLSAEKEKEYKKQLARVKEADRKALFDFVRDTYAPAIVSKHFYMRLQRVVFGTDPKIPFAIPSDELHDEWQRLLPELERIDAYNRAHGKNIENRWDYDFAIVLRKYPSYKRWKEKQKRNAEESNNVAELLKNKKPARPSAVNHQTATGPKKHSDDVDISSVLDDLYDCG